jgi:hypothetical protein
MAPRILRLNPVKLAIVGLLVILAARVAWHASRAEVGWEVIRHEWVRTLAGLVGMDRPALAEREPEDQARFWLSEVERLGADRGSPQFTAGAAWMLDAPGAEFMQRHLRENQALRGFPGQPLGVRVKLDHAAIRLSVDRFEDLCRERCLQLIEHATRADPINVELCRTRALLQFQFEFLGIGFQPRNSDWRLILAECARHDPENALYDYLAALADWRKGADYHWEQAGHVLDVLDQEAFQRESESFTAGLAKPRLLFPLSCYKDTLAFLENCEISKFDRLQAAEERRSGFRASSLLYSLSRRQVWKASAQCRNGEFAAAATTLQENLRIVDQVSTTDSPAGLSVERLAVRHFALANQEKLAHAAPGLFDARELEAMAADHREVQVNLNVYGTVSNRIQAKDQLQPGLARSAAAPVAMMAPRVASVLLLLALCFAVLCRLGGGSRPPETIGVSGLLHVTAWGAGQGLSYVVFGLCPAAVISVEIQTRVVLGMLAAVLILPLIGISMVVHRKTGVGFGQLTALSLSFAIPWVALFYGAGITDSLIGMVGGLAPLEIIFLGAGFLVAGWFMAKADLSFLRRTDVSNHVKMRLVILAQLFAAFTVPWGRKVADYADIAVCIPPRAWNEALAWGLNATDLQLALNLQAYPWLRSFLQWDAYQGFYIGLGLSVLFSTLLLMIRLRRVTPGGIGQIARHEKRMLVRLVAVATAKSFALAGLCALVVYLATVQALIAQRELYYQRHLARLLDPEQYRQEIEAEIAAIQNDSPLMEKLRESAEK